MNKNIRDVNKMAEAILKDEELMDAIDAKVDEQIEKKLRLEFAYEQGEKQKSMEIAKEMKKANKPIEEIIQFTGLTKEEIEELG